MPLCNINMKCTLLFTIGVLVACSAVVLLLPGALGQSLVPRRSDRASELQRLVNDLGYQLQQVEQHDEPEAQQRLRQLAIALDRWNHSKRSEQDFQAMQQWLTRSIRASLPGQPTAMPELPWFGQRMVVAETPRNSKSTPAVEPSSEEPRTKNVQALLKQHPAAQPIDLGNPFVDDEPQSPAAANRRLALRPTAVSVAQSTSRVDINVAELSARIRGYVHGLRAVEGRLMESRELAANELAGVLRELHELAGQRELVSMYLGALSPEAAARSPELPALSSAIALASERVQRIRAAGEDRLADTLQAMLDAI